MTVRSFAGSRARLAAAAATPWLQVAMVALLAATATVSLFQASVLTGPVPLDFTARYAAGQLADDGVSPYDTGKLLAAVQALRPDLAGEDLPFYDPPPTAAAFRLVSQLPFETGAALWEILSVACLAVIGWLLADLIGIHRPSARLAIVSLLLLFSPVRHSIRLGQVEAVLLLPLFVAIWLCVRRPPSAPVVACSSALAVVSLCKPQLAYLLVAVVVAHCYRRHRLATSLGAAAAAATLVLVALLVAPSAHWGEWLTALRHQPDSPNWPLRVVLLIGGLTGVVLAFRAALACRGSFQGWLLLAASCNGLGVAVVRWNPQWHVVLVLPMLALLALFLGQGAQTWPRRDQLVLALVVAMSLPYTWDNLTFYTDLLHAVIPLAVSAVVLAAAAVTRLVRASWAAITFVLTAALVVPPIKPYLHFGLTQVEGVVFCLGVLWLLPWLAGASRTGQPIDLASVRELRPA
jgi:Glycosyltransferase family 87